ncbi:hypothetical protein MKX03_028653 [Papaver bracteatum]|nr:hypothetical protein MKX03_028653 [Papaver bracteatum]
MPSKIENSHTSVRFQWRLTDFSKLGCDHESEVFSVRNLKWKVQIYPKGENGPNGTVSHLSLFLKPVDKNKTPYAEYSFVLKSHTDSRNNVTQPVGKHRFTGIGRGWKTFIPLNQLHDRSKGYLQHDTCIIEVMVTCLTSEARA